MLKKSKKKEIISETIYRSIREMIFLNRYKPGLHLNAERLSRELSVSRTPVWNAIRRLEREGVVRRVPNRGVLVVENSLERVQEQLLVLNALDRLAVRLTCNRMTEKTIDLLSNCLTDQLRGMETEDLVLFGTAEMRFYGYIHEASGVSYLKELFDSITSQLLPSEINFLPILPAIYLANEEVLEALKENNTERVEKAIDRHIQITMGQVKTQIESRAKQQEIVRRAKEKREAGTGKARTKRVRPV